MKEKWRFLDKPVDDAVAKHLFDKLHKETWHITQKPKAKFLSGITPLNQSNHTRNNLSSTHLCLAATQGLPFPVLALFLQKNWDGDQGVHRKVSLCRLGVMGRGKEGGYSSSPVKPALNFPAAGTPSSAHPLAPFGAFKPTWAQTGKKIFPRQLLIQPGKQTAWKSSFFPQQWKSW